MTCVNARPNAMCDWHTHTFDELCLVEGGATAIGHAGRKYPAPAGTLFLFRAGERHGFWNDHRQHPRLWVLHFITGADTYRDLEQCAAGEPRARIWRLRARQVAEYLAQFKRVAAENASSGPGSVAAESARIRLMLVSVARWAARVGDGDARATSPSAAPQDAQLVPLWRLVVDSTDPLGELLRQFSTRISNYDSLRHRFRRTFGCSPREMATRVRLSRARALLIESGMSVKEIAAAVGYGRQHEFTRAFRRVTGVSPTDFRRNPITFR
jgi:hypothetical protein